MWVLSCMLSILCSISISNAAQEQAQLQQKPYLWVYWENINGATKMPAHISLCRKTLIKHCRSSFNLIELNEKNIYQYLPDLKRIEKALGLDRLKIAQKVDFYRIFLLYRHGGMYIDSDMIVMKNLKEVTDRLKDYDYVGFGEYYCKIGAYNSYGAPQNWAMASRRHGTFITKALKAGVRMLLAMKKMNRKQIDLFIKQLVQQEELLTRSSLLQWHSLGKFLLAHTLKPMINNDGYDYFHYPSDVDGTRDIRGNFIKTSDIFAKPRITFRNIERILFIFISNAHINAKMRDKLVLTEKQLLDENTNFAFYVRKSLGMPPYSH